MLAFMSVPEYFNSPIKLLYEDSDKIKDAPERFPGQGPNIGYRIEDFPAGKILIFKANLVFTDNIEGTTPALFAEQMQAQPHVTSSFTRNVASGPLQSSFN